MGYQGADLDRIEVGTAKGTGFGWMAKKPCTATVAGAVPPMLTVRMRPTFVESANALWGRGDVMRLFALTVEDAESRFTLSW